MKDTSFDCRPYVGPGINTLTSFSDGLGPSNFCLKMEKARPMRKMLMEMLFTFRQSQQSDFDVVIYKKLFPICILTW